MGDIEKPIRGICTGCREVLAGDQIFHWSPSSWSVWCFQCYKAEHYPNLRRITQYAGDCDRCGRRTYHGGYPQPITVGSQRLCKECAPPERGRRD